MEAAAESRKSAPLRGPSKRARTTEPLGPLATPEVEREHVHKVYDSIASHWHGTRYKAWPKVQAFVEVSAGWARGRRVEVKRTTVGSALTKMYVCCFVFLF
jgi:hypothetical protein